MAGFSLIFPSAKTAPGQDYPGDQSTSFQGHKDRGSANPGVDFGCYYQACWAPAKMLVTSVSNSVSGSGGRNVFGTLLNPDGSASGFRCIFMHLDQIDVNEGDVLEQGQHVGITGSSANGRPRNGVGPHLHFTLFLNGIWVDPMLYLGLPTEAAETVKKPILLEGTMGRLIHWMNEDKWLWVKPGTSRNEFGGTAIWEQADNVDRNALLAISGLPHLELDSVQLGSIRTVL